MIDQTGPMERTPAPVPKFTGRHYSVDELAEMWKLSRQTITGYFENEPGVVRISGARPRVSKGQRRITLRIPEPVVERVYQRMVVST